MSELLVPRRSVTDPLDPRSDQYVDRIVRECMADRLPAPRTKIRLQVAVMLGRTLDRVFGP